MTRLKVVPKGEDPNPQQAAGAPEAPPPPPPMAPLMGAPPPPPGDPRQSPYGYQGTRVMVQPQYGQPAYQYGPPQYPAFQPPAPTGNPVADMIAYQMWKDERDKQEREAAKAKQAQAVERAKPAADKAAAPEQNPVQQMLANATALKEQAQAMKSVHETLGGIVGPDKLERILNTETVKVGVGHLFEGLGSLIKSQVSVQEHKQKAEIDIQKEKELLRLRGQLPEQQKQQQAVPMQPAQQGAGAPPPGSPQNPYVVPGSGQTAQPGTAGASPGAPAGAPAGQWQPRPDVPLQSQVEVRVQEEDMRAIRENDERLKQMLSIMQALNNRLDQIEGKTGQTIAEKSQLASLNAQAASPQPPVPSAAPQAPSASATPQSVPYSGSSPAGTTPSAPPQTAGRSDDPATVEALKQMSKGPVVMHRFACLVPPCSGKPYAFVAPTSVHAAIMFRDNHMSPNHPTEFAAMNGELIVLRERRLGGAITEQEEKEESVKVIAKYYASLGSVAAAQSDKLIGVSMTGDQAQLPPSSPPSPSPIPPVAASLEANGGIAAVPAGDEARGTVPQPVGGEQPEIFPVRCKRCPPGTPPSKFQGGSWESVAGVWWDYHFGRKHPQEATAYNQSLLKMRQDMAAEADAQRKELLFALFQREAARIQSEVSEFLPTESIPSSVREPPVEQPQPPAAEPPVSDSFVDPPREDGADTSPEPEDQAEHHPPVESDSGSGEDGEAEADGASAPAGDAEEAMPAKEAGRASRKKGPGERAAAAGPEATTDKEPPTAGKLTRRSTRKKGGRKKRKAAVQGTLTADEKKKDAEEDDSDEPEGHPNP